MTASLVALLLNLWACPGRAQSETPVMGGVVRSKEWRIRRAPEKEEEFIGAVSYRAADTAIKADWALYRHAARTWKARGNVDAERRLSSGDVVEARGEEAFYDQGAEIGVLSAKDRVTFERRPAAGEPDRGSAGKLRWEARAKAFFSGGVRVWGPRMESWSDEAAYDRALGELTLTGGRPVLRKLEGDWTGVVKADVITAWESPRRVEADGKTRGWIEFPAKGQAAEIPR